MAQPGVLSTAGLAGVNEVVAFSGLGRGWDVRAVPHWDPGPSSLALRVVPRAEQVLREADYSQGYPPA